MMPILGLLLPVVALVLAACGGGAVIFAPTPLPPDESPIRYEHPSGAFSMIVPRQWTVYTQDREGLAVASFAPPNRPGNLVRASVINLGESITPQQMGQWMSQYQTQIRPDLASYKETDRQATGTGGWRISGIREDLNGPRPLNTFFDRHGAYLSVLEVTVPQEASLQREVQTLINTFTVAPGANLSEGTLALLAGAADAQLEVVHVTPWTTPEGVFYLTGEVRNNGQTAVAGLPVRALLLDESGAALVEAVDEVMGHALLPGRFAPFSLRFGAGQPPEARQYTLSLGGEAWSPGPVPPLAADDALTYTDALTYGAEGQLFISGTLTNTGEQRLRAARVMVTVFDEAQTKVIGAGWTQPDVPFLAPGDSAPYTLVINDLGGEAGVYNLSVQAIVCEGGVC